MLKNKCIAFTLLLVAASLMGSAQRMNVGLTFQYLIGKQVAVKGNSIQGPSGKNYSIIDNRFKLFSAGQSFVVGTIVQMDYKKIYIAAEPSFELNTYNYRVGGASPEEVTFKTLFYQIDMPLYVGYQFHSSDVIRYSFFAGVEPVFPYHTEVSFPQAKDDPTISQRYPVTDMRNVIYTGNSYWNGMIGMGFHFASLGRFDIRYTHRLSSPGSIYTTTFNTVGIALSYFLPLNVRKKRIYYEE